MKIDKDIERVKEIITHKDDYDVCFGYRIAKPYSVSAEEIQAISNVLSELETYKKIAEKLAEELSKHIWLNDKDAIIKIYREKVEEDEIHS